MTTKYITERIREYYCADKSDDEWLVEKGKVKEGRMLKEACLEIESLRQLVTSQHSKLNQQWLKGYEHDNKLTKPLESEIRKLKNAVSELYNILKSVKETMNNFKGQKENIC